MYQSIPLSFAGNMSLSKVFRVAKGKTSMKTAMNDSKLCFASMGAPHGILVFTFSDCKRQFSASVCVHCVNMQNSDHYECLVGL